MKAISPLFCDTNESFSDYSPADPILTPDGIRHIGEIVAWFTLIRSHLTVDGHNLRRAEFSPGAVIVY